MASPNANSYSVIRKVILCTKNTYITIVVRNYNSPVSRRTVLKSAAAGVSLAALGHSVVATKTMDDRFIITTGRRVKDQHRRDIQNAGLEITGRLDPIGLVIARGSSSAVKKTGFEYAPDVQLELKLPLPRSADDLETQHYDDVDGADGELDSIEGDDLSDYQWDKQSQQIRDVHRDYTKGANVRVANIDSGIDDTHPDLNNFDHDASEAFTTGTCGAPGPYSGGHGTATAGIIAAEDNGVGITGMAPDVELVDCRVFPPRNDFECSDGPDYEPRDMGHFHLVPGAAFGNVLQAIVHAAYHDCDVANMSLGVGYYSRSWGFGKYYGRSWARATSYANSKGMLLVSAAGNAGHNLNEDKDLVSTLTEAPNVMSVSATSPTGFKWGDDGYEEPVWDPADYTNHGKNVIDVSAPGGDWNDRAVPHDKWRDLVPSTSLMRNEGGTPWYPLFTASNGAKYRWLAGTSMASPQVAGAAALVKGVYPDAAPKRVASILQKTADDVAGNGATDYHGHGFLNTLAAVREAEAIGK